MWDVRYQHVKDLALNGQWKEELIKTLFPEDIVTLILYKINTPEKTQEGDKFVWCIKSKVLFIVK